MATKKILDLARLEQYNNLVKAKFVQPSNINVETSTNDATVTFTGVGTTGVDTKTITFTSPGGTFTTSDDTITFTPDSAAEYSVKKLTTAEDGYIASYQLTKDGAPVGDKINIPKDYLVKGAEINTVTEGDKEEGGIFYNNGDFDIGDKYIDFTINVAEGTSDESHLYINVTEIAQVYTAGNGIDITETPAADDGAAYTVAVKIDTANANGLSVGAGGIALAPATTSTPGAMSAADKTKLDQLDTAYAKGLVAEANASAGVDLKLQDGQTTPATLATVNVKSADTEAITVTVQGGAIVVTPVLATEADITALFA